jgi:hypothetical protein
VSDATALVITEELLLIDAGNAQARMWSPIKGLLQRERTDPDHVHR